MEVKPGSADRDWRKSIRARVTLQVGANAPWFQVGEPLVLAARFHFLRPKTHHVANDRDRPLKKNAPGPGDYAQKPDL